MLERVIQERLARDNPSVLRFATELARSYDSLGGIYDIIENADSAMESYEKAAEIGERLARDGIPAEIATEIMDGHSWLNPLWKAPACLVEGSARQLSRYRLWASVTVKGCSSRRRFASETLP